ncbi:DUF177 domain-containing protein [Bosea sp. 117]|uniref:YceD family protein n=1 Tax=Bosea sp. 117 TaxID=1125973 RepID=UPI000494790A|nr:DUF177 domain-containing protein [Bosea sp. 117]
MTAAPALSHPVVVAQLPEGGATFHLEPDEGTRAALAKQLDIVAVPALRAIVHLVPDGRGGVNVEGRVDATVRQTCVATLEPFDAPLSEEIEMHFVPEGRLPEVRPGSEVEVSADDIPDPIVNGIIDVGAVASEFLALGLDPYPRKPGAVFQPPADTTGEGSPFAALAGLRRGAAKPDDEE